MPAFLLPYLGSSYFHPCTLSFAIFAAPSFTLVKEYLVDACGANRGCGKHTGGPDRTILYGLQRPPMNGQDTVLRCGASTSFDELAPTLVPFYVTNAADALRVSVDPANEALLSQLQGISGLKGKVVVETAAEFQGVRELYDPSPPAILCALHYLLSTITFLFHIFALYFMLVLFTPPSPFSPGDVFVVFSVSLFMLYTLRPLLFYAGVLDSQDFYNVVPPEALADNNNTSSLEEFPMVGQFVSLYFPMGHIKSTRHDDEAFVEYFTASEKWLKIRC